MFPSEGGGGRRAEMQRKTGTSRKVRCASGKGRLGEHVEELSLLIAYVDLVKNTVQCRIEEEET